MNANHDLEPIDPSTARELYLDHKATHCTEATVQGHHYRTKHIVAWCEENGINVEPLSEAWMSQKCPNCGERDRTRRHRETLTCPCGFDGHADLVASRTLLERATNTEVRPTARPVRFQWDDHQWSPVEGAAVGPNE